MIQELLYTSAPKGLKPGSRGFCTVLSTQGMSAPLAAALEGLSGYRPLFAPTDSRHAENPVVHSHLTSSVGGRRVNVLSRIADYGLDYTQRTNKLAHHVVIDPQSQPAGGPAWLLGRRDFMRTSWEGEPRVVPIQQSAPGGDAPAGICTHWQNATGDAGWAGVLAEAFLADPRRMAFLICPIGLDPLPLLAEAIALLPRERRWDVTFSTYFTGVPQTATCAWRCLIEGTPEVHQSRRYVQALRIDLTQPLGQASGGPLVEAARTGRLPNAAKSRTVVQESPSPLAEKVEVRPPASAAGYRLQPVRKVDHPPLLGLDGERRRKLRGVQVAGALLAVGIVIALVATGLFLLKGKRPSGNEAITAGLHSDSVAELDGLAFPENESTASTPSRNDLPNSEADSDSIVQNVVQGDKASVQRDTPPAGHADGGTRLPAADRSEHPPSESSDVLAVDSQREVSPPSNASQNEVNVTETPAVEPVIRRELTTEFVAVRFQDSVAPEDVPPLRLELQDTRAADARLVLFTPPEYEDRVRSDESSTDHELHVTYFDRTPGIPPSPVADITLRPSPQSPTQSIVELAWKGKFQRESIGWCALSIYIAGQAERRYILHANRDEHVQNPRTWKRPFLLPQLPHEPLPGRIGPTFRAAPFKLTLGESEVTFSSSDKTQQRSSLNCGFQVSSFADLGVVLNEIDLGNLSPKELPELRLSVVADAANTPTTLKSEIVNLRPCTDAFVQRCRTRMADAQAQHKVHFDRQKRLPSPDLWFERSTALDSEQSTWETTRAGVDQQISMQAEQERKKNEAAFKALKSVVDGCIEDAHSLKALDRELDNAIITSAHIYYEVTDCNGQSFPVDILRIIPGPATEVDESGTESAGQE